ncbi:flagellar hook capping protein [Clostridium fermenticellae]|uniref:Basal-body rod modification protein FlgD n=1 Tax=Clostridium fermenticellae TaxID=2068654 RepID=A0A386H4T5_9CLOT|nr:flagellar hook capping FlgD N-terminal domain-containing protein [Clostridium fermenticellae]AYD40680.1 flagellar hook capping protein [Clostridium fermenticellae]
MTAVTAADNTTTINDRLSQLSSNSSSTSKDENLFLKILAAELQNQDPTNAKDGTEYVSQMAQFSELQQMANLNTTLKMSSANSLIGNIVVLNKLDQNGNYYAGKVMDIIKNGDEIDLDVIVGQIKDSDGNLQNDVRTFTLDNVQAVGRKDDTGTSGTNMDLLNAAALIGKMVTLSDTDDNNNNYTGTIKSISKESDGIKVNVQMSTGETKEFSIDDITSVSDS